jgi:glyoxylase-like metal-dependent hydrolase (beta-lactamase superfamily II)
MVRERVAENVYVFTSDLYASVNAGAVIGPDWSILIDTLAFPEETREIRNFLEEDLGSRVRYVINTHYHADHSFGTSWFPGAVVIGHAMCRQLLDTLGRKGLEEAQQAGTEFRDVEIVLPDVVVDQGRVILRLGKRSVEIIPLPGHSPDGIGVHLMDEHVLFAGDVMMSVPYLVDGDYDAMVDSLKKIPKLKLESLIQGHGDVVLRGEVGTAVKANIQYLNQLRKHVRKAGRRKDPMAYLEDVDIESCGKSRILLNGLARELHERNLTALLKKWYPEKAEEVA